MSEPIVPGIWAETTPDGQTFAMVRIPLERPAPGASNLAEARKVLDRTARGVMETAYPEGWTAEGERIATLYRETRKSIQAAEEQIRALAAQRESLFTQSGVSGERFDEVDDLQSRAESRKALAEKRLKVVREKAEAHAEALRVALNTSQAKARLLSGSAFERDASVLAAMRKACNAVLPVADSLLEDSLVSRALEDRKGSLNYLPSELADEWLRGATGQ